LTSEQKASAARELLRGDLLTEVVQDIQESIASQWAEADNAEERDKLWHLQKSIEMFKDVVEGYVSNYDYQQKIK
tara:strand:+ start:4828 stop:5052 length:225 start_codon:yes stop_codon:yes gene_type:complete